MLPLDGLLVLDISQFLAGPSAALRLADFGATVIKVERPGVGELGRQLYISDLELDSDSILFHTINRNKRSYAANLKDARDLAAVRRLISKADVLIENFRPGVMDRLGLGYEEVRRLKPEIVYATVTGYGSTGPWKDKPGQDLLVQAVSGLAWLSGNRDAPPTPMGLAVVDMFAGAHLTQGILSCLVRRNRTGQGGRVEVSLLESALDMQFEVLTTYLNDGGKLPSRGSVNNAHAYLSAPYGIYETADGYVALAMGSIPDLAKILEIAELEQYADRSTWFEFRDVIKSALARRLQIRTTADWLSLLEPQDVWCADVLDWEQLVQHRGFDALAMTQTVGAAPSRRMVTTRCPIRLDGETLTSPMGAPQVGEHTAKINQQYRLTELQRKRIGVIGVGTMGAPMARRLLSVGVAVGVYNRTPKKSDSLAEMGATVATSPARLAEQSDVVLLMLSDDASVSEAVCGSEGIASSSAKDLIVINSSTVSPDTNIRLAKVLQDRGIAMLDAPVTGSRPQAEAGTLFFLVGGDEKTYEACVPLFEVLGRGHLHLGPIGAGACAKLANNLMGFINLTGLIEALNIAVGFGLAPEMFLKVVANGGGRSAISEAKGVKISAKDWRTDFSIKLAAKDLHLTRQLTEKLSLESPILKTVETVFTRAVEEVGDKDVCALYELYEQRNMSG